jgi:hypothetical protein
MHLNIGTVSFRQHASICREYATTRAGEIATQKPHGAPRLQRKNGPNQPTASKRSGTPLPGSVQKLAFTLRSVQARRSHLTIENLRRARRSASTSPSVARTARPLQIRENPAALPDRSRTARHPALCQSLALHYLIEHRATVSITENLRSRSRSPSTSPSVGFRL